jgi:hypothetical protein
MRNSGVRNCHPSGSDLLALALCFDRLVSKVELLIRRRGCRGWGCFG